MSIRATLEKWIHPVLLAVIILLLSFGAGFLRTAVHADSSFKKQLIGIALGLVLLAIAWVIDYRKLKDWIFPLFLLDIFLLISPRIPGLSGTAKGASRWLTVPFTNISLFQPSEPAKLVTIVLLAAIVANYEGIIDSWRDFAKLVGLSLIPFFAVMMQPDLGTGMVFIIIMLGLLLVGGAKSRYLLALLAAAAVLIPLVFWLNGFTYSEKRGDGGDYLLIKEYQLERLTVFLNPTKNTKRAAYNLNQSKIAIGSGGLKGKGLGEGTQSQLNFLPERSTDFIFSVLGEETGFTGCVMLMGLYLALLIVSLSIAASSSDIYGTLIVTGIISMWAFQILENAGMTMGIMPITGIPLPFMSYGSSFMVTNLAAVGMLLSIWRHRPYQSSLKGISHELTL